MEMSQQFVDFKKKSQQISRCSSFDIIVEGFEEFKLGKKFESAKIPFLDSDDEWWISIEKGSFPRFFAKSTNDTLLTFFLKTSDCFLKSWKCYVSGTINGVPFNTVKQIIYQKEMIFQHCCRLTTTFLKLQLQMKMSQDEDLMVSKQKFVDTTRQFKQIVSNNATILNGSKYSDFTFIVDGQMFKVHKNILAAASPVFDKMFESKLSETVRGECSVTNIKPPIFQYLLDFIYGGQLPQQLHEDTLSRELFQAAHFYQINGLVDICSSVERYKLTKDNAVDMYEWADTYGLENIKIDAWKIIQFGILEIFEEKQPPSMHVLKALIAADEEKKKYMKTLRLEIGKLEAKKKDLLK